VTVSPLPSLRALASTVRVGDVIAQPLWTVRPRRPAWEAAAELAAREFDVAAVADDPINRFVTLVALQSSKGTVAGVARPIRASDIVSASLPLDDLFSVLATRSEVFVIEGDRVTGLVTRSDLQSPAVGLLVFAHLLAIEGALSALVLEEFGTDVLDRLPDGRRMKADQAYASAVENGVQIGIGECLNLSDWLTLARGSAQLMERLGTSKTRWDKRTSRLVGIRDDLAHGRSILHRRDALDAIRTFVDARSLAEELWRVVAETSRLWSKYLHTTISRIGRGRRPVAGRNATATWPWAGPVHVVTAWNPSSIVRPKAVNDAANRELEAVLRERHVDVERVIGRSDDRAWSEESLLVAGLSRAEAAELGCRFGQLAVFELDADEMRVLQASDGHVAGRAPRRR
jgi:hypothetical protein